MTVAATHDSSLLRDMAQSSPMVLWAMDASGNCTSCTGKGLEQHGWNEGEAVGWNLLEVFADSPNELAQLRRALTGEPFRAEHESIRGHFITWFRPQFDQTGTLYEVVGVTLDRNAAGQVQSHLRQNEQARQSRLIQLMAVQDTDRQELAQDLHDDTLQVLASLDLRIQLLERHVDAATSPELTAELNELHGALQGAVDRFRSMIFTLEPPPMAAGLINSLGELSVGILNGSGVVFEVVDRCAVPVDAHASALLYRVAQEALGNVLRHADAQVVVITVASEAKGWSLTVCDDGRGPGPGGYTERRGHRGLAGMRGRVSAAGGTFVLHAGMGGGTELRAWVPTRSGTLMHNEPTLDLREPLREILDEADEAFVALDRDWRYVFVNKRAAEIASRPVRELEGANIWVEFPGSVGSNFYVQCMRSMAEQRTVEFADYYNGRWLENRLVPTSHGLFAFYRDVTEQRRTWRRVDPSSDASGLLLAAVATASSAGTDPLERLKSLLECVVESRWFSAARITDRLGRAIIEVTSSVTGPPQSLDDSPQTQEGRAVVVAEPLLGEFGGLLELEGRPPSQFEVRWLAGVLAAIATPDVARLRVESEPAP